MRTACPLILMILAVGCSRSAPPAYQSPPAVPEPSAVAETQDGQAPTIVPYPGGTVERRDGRIISRATTRVRSHSPRNVLLARRGAYLIAMRNASLFAEGLVLGQDGLVSPLGEDVRSPIELNVSGAREIGYNFDRDTGQVTVAVEVDRPIDSR